MSWNALGRGYSAILAQHYQHRIHHLQHNGKTLSTKGPKISARIRKNISVRMHDSRATGEMLGHETMAMTGWYVEKATAPLVGLVAGLARGTACRGEVAPQHAGLGWWAYRGVEAPNATQNATHTD